MLRRLAVALTGVAIAGSGLFGSVPSAGAACEINLGGKCEGDCYINYGSCQDDGTCYLNAGTCDADCTYNLGTCAQPPAVDAADVNRVIRQILHAVEG